MHNGKESKMEDEKLSKVRRIETSLHKHLMGLIILSQCFGLFPVQGLIESDTNRLRFSWKSKRVIYSLILTGASFFVTLMTFFHIFMSGMQLRNCTVSTFYANGFLINVLFLRIAKNWPKLMSKWKNVETSMLSYGYPRYLLKKIIIISFVVISAATVEHTLSIYKAVQDASESFADRQLEEIMNLYFAFIFNYIQFNYALSILLLTLNTIAQFSWNFMDLFIMVMSIALAERFGQINCRIKNASKIQIKTIYFWKNVREDYNELSKLFTKLEREISTLILVSFATNLCLILIQLFQSLHRRGSGVENFYFFSSFGLLVLRTVGVTLFAAKVNDESKTPLHLLHNVPAEVYTKEVERFMVQIRHDIIALTGWKLFNVTRGLLCSMAGTIVTYELLLFQFNVSITY